MHFIQRGNGHAILFMHGMPTNGNLWNGVIERLADRHRCFAVDLPGMGKTPFRPYGPDYLDHVADEIETVRIQSGVRKWHVVGHDAGAAIAVHYAGRFPERVGCLALLSPAIFPDLKPFFLLNCLRRPVVGELLAPLLHLLFWHVAMRRALGGASDRSQFNAFYRPFSGPSGAWQLMRLVRWGKPAQVLGKIPAELSKLPMPALLFHGSRDVLPASFAQRAASLIRHSTVVTLDSGHFLPLDRTDDIAASLHTFFVQHRTAMQLPPRSRQRKIVMKDVKAKVFASSVPDYQSSRALQPHEQ